MSPKVVTSRNEIAQAAFEIVREEGHEFLTVRHIAERLGCSTQPCSTISNPLRKSGRMPTILQKNSGRASLQS